MTSNMQINVLKRNGLLEKINVDKINKSVERACEGLEDVSASEIVLDASIQLYDGIKTSEIDKSLIDSARSKIEKEPNYSNVAARLLLNCLYKEVFKKSVSCDSLEEEYRESFKENLIRLVDNQTLNPELLTTYNISTLAKYIKPERDFQFEYIGIQTLVDRYLQKISDVICETPQAFFMRVAMGLALKEKKPEFWAKKFYDELSSFNYMTSTPTLFNAGTIHNQLSSCFLSTMGDSEDGIMGCIHDQARMSKYAGGLGVDVTSIRGTRARIKSTNGRSSGPIPFIKILNDTVLAFDQGGRRKGSCAVYMEPWHIDYEHFLELLKKTGDDRRRTHELHTASWIPDLLFKKVEADEDWYMFSPHEVPKLHETYGEEFENEYNNAISLAKQGKILHKIIKAKDLMRNILKFVFETGHPWFTFKDQANKCYSQKEYIIHNTNLCTEIFRHNMETKYSRGQKTEYGETAVCNLASLNLKNHINFISHSIDWNKLKNTIKVAIRGLDNVIDQNFYPIPETEISNKKHRPIGLGIMGFADVLHAFNLPYDCQEAVELSERIQQFIYYHGLKASCSLAKEKGKFETFDTSEWAKGIMHHDLFTRQIEIKSGHLIITKSEIEGLRNEIKEYGLRNANVFAIAPTATISYIVGCSQSIEPDYSLLFAYSTLSGNFTMVNRWFINKAKRIGKWNSETLNKLKINNGDVKYLDISPEIKKEFANVFDIDYKMLGQCASARQKWIDMGQSFNIYCDKPSLKRLYEMYLYFWKCGLKSTYYLRTLGASQAEKTTVEGNVLDTKQVKECSIEAMKRGEICESCQ